MLEKNIEKRLGKEVKKLGCLYYKFVSPGNSGVPDRIIIAPSGVVIFVELKTEVGKKTALQWAQINKLRGHNQRVVTVYGIFGVEKLVDLLKRRQYDLIPTELR